MKACTYLLSIYILFLCFAPGVKAIGNSQKTQISCCENCGHILTHQKVPLTKQESKGRTKKLCNPFEMCKTCIGFHSASLSVCYTPVSSVFAKLEANNEEAPKNLALDFWQPPKLS